ncbi:LiaG family protein [Bacillus seohaeanensis]|uniref:DUF4097 family beta strand repeat-containing protein n=1 Tax=Bacillus seohaeanensis TaxID=284580 RepID=A0ABW5RU66_9BACI
MKMKNSLFILLFIVIGLGIIFYNSNLFSWFSFGDHDNQASVNKNTELIEIDVSSVKAKIIPEDRNDLEATLDGKGKLIVKENRDSIEVKVKKKWFQWFSFNNKSQLTIYIPEDYERDMEIELGSGNLEFSGKSQNTPFKLNELSVEIGSGKANLKNITAKQFDQEVSSGDINIDSLITTDGTIDVSSGDIKISRYTGPLKAKVSSGFLKVQMDELSDPIQIDVSSGSAKLDLPSNADFHLKGKVSSGDINCNFPLITKKVSGNKSIEGTHGSGKNRIDLDLSSGYIDIY